MKICVAIFLISLAAMPALAGGGLDIGDRMPATDAMLTNTDMSQISLSQVIGAKGTLVVFSCNHCPWAQAWEQRIVELGNSYLKKDVGVIVINSNDPKLYPTDGIEHMKTRVAEMGYQMPYVVDAGSKVAKKFGATRTPDIFLFDAQNTLVYTGAFDDNSEKPEKVTKTYLQDAMEALLAGQPIATPKTKAIGCSIKYY
jgi:hypothetical protein